MKKQRGFVWILILALLSPATGVSGAAALVAPADEAVSVIRQDCGGYSDCYTSLAAWEAAYGGLPNGDLVAQDKIAVARIEGAWTQADAAPLELNGWTTDAGHYLRIYTAGEARHNGAPGSGYRLEPTSGAPINSSVAHFRIEGLEIHSMSASSPVYARPGPEIQGDIRLSHNLIHGNGADSGSGIYVYDYDGVLKIWNNVIYDVAGLGYHGGIQTSRGTTTIYNNTIVDMIAGFAIRSGGGVVLVKNNLTESSNDDYSGSFYPGSDFNAASDDTAPGFNSRRDQTFSFVNRGAKDFHLASSDAGARNYGADLSFDAGIPITDDVDGQARSGGWDIGADEATGGADSVPPIRSNGAPAGTLPSDTTEVTLSLSTHEAATCRYAAAPGVAYASMPNTFAVTGGITHTHLVGGLADEQTYTYYVRCQDTAGSANEDDYEISFYIFSADATPPVISNVQTISITPYSAEITWETDEACTSQVEYGVTGDYGARSLISSTRVTAHSLALAGLDPATAYHFRVRSRDVAYNETVSAGSVLTTAALSNLYYVNQKHAQASDENPGTIDEPWLTIQRAADVAQPGDTVIVYPGDYGRTAIRHGGAAGQIITFKGLNVPDRSLVDPGALFDPANPVQIPGNPTLNTVTQGFDLAPSYGVTVPVGYVRIEAMEVTAIGPSGGRGGLRLQNTDSVELIRNFIHDLNPTDYNYIGVRGDGHDNLNTVVKGNVLYRVQGTGIGIVGRNWLVEGNEVSHNLDANTDTGVHVGGDSDAVRFFGSGHVIRNNFFHDSLDEEQYGDPHIDCFQTFAVYPESQFAHDILIEGNTCDNFGQMLMIEDNESGNYVHHITFRNNIFRGARAFAINGGCDHFTFVNNIVAGSNYGAIGLGRSPYLTMLNNIFYNNGSGAQISDEDSKVGSVWDYNLHYPDFSWPPKQPGYDQHGLFGVDPRFLAPVAGDYHLRVDSPAVDAGAALPEFNYDMDFVERPQGAGWDIGPHESVPLLVLRGMPDNRAIRLNWAVNVPLPVTATWTIAYEAPGSAYLPLTGILSPTRAYTLTDLTNYEWYTVTLHAMVDGASWLSDTVRVMPTDIRVYLPLVTRELNGILPAFDAYGAPVDAPERRSPMRITGVITAAGCSQPEIQTAIEAAGEGDTVQVPAGQCEWSQPVRLENKAITLQGAGMEETTITDMTGNAWNEPALWIEGLDGQSIRVTGFGIHYGLNSSLQDYNGAIVVRGSSRTVRIDHCKFTDFWNRSIQISGYTYGLIDHCVFQRTPEAVNSFQAINVNGDSDAAWLRPLTLGSANAVYIEDNVFDFYGSGTAADSHSSGRFVFRMNDLRNGAMLNHGLDTTDRSSHSFEIYDNHFHREAYTFNIITIRGGTGVIFRNTITSDHNIDIPIIAQLYRSCNDYPETHGVRCNGTNPIDGNQDPSGYPCKDQHGRTTGQALSPIYVWDNAFNATSVGMSIFDPWHCTDPAMTDHLKESRDFYNGVYRPLYVPYPYPHPLTLGDYPGEQRSLELQGWASPDQAQLAWQAVTGAVSYRVVRDWDETGALTTTSTVHHETWIGPERVYMVYALDGAGTILTAEGTLLSSAELNLRGYGGDETIRLDWTVNTPLPATATWTIAYQSPGSAYLPVTGILSPTHDYTLTDLTNYEWYTVTLHAMVDGASWLSDTVRVMPTDIRVYLPLVLRNLP